MKLVIPLHFISWKKTPTDAVTPQHQSQFTPKMKANAVPRLLSSLVWIDQYNECNGMIGFIEFMWFHLLHHRSTGPLAVNTTCGATYNIPNLIVLVLLSHFVNGSKSTYQFFVIIKSVLDGHNEAFSYLQILLNFLHESIKVWQNLDRNLSFLVVLNTSL